MAFLQLWTNSNIDHFLENSGFLNLLLNQKNEVNLETYSFYLIIRGLLNL